MRFLRKYPKQISVFLIRLYQKTLSPDHSPLANRYPYGFCRYYPSCSEYGVRAIERYGVISGGVRTLWRIIRCNPLSRGGVDDV